MSKFDRLSKAVAGADLDRGLMPGKTLIEICEDSRVLIEHHNGIAGYGNCEIRVKVKLGNVFVCGRDLTVLSMTKEKMVIGGVIEAVRICRGG